MTTLLFDFESTIEPDTRSESVNTELTATYPDSAESYALDLAESIEISLRANKPFAAGHTFCEDVTSLDDARDIIKTAPYDFWEEIFGQQIDFIEEMLDDDEIDVGNIEDAAIDWGFNNASVTIDVR